MSKIDIHSNLNSWHFNWSIIDVLLNGKSSIDLPNLDIDNEEEAKQFLKTYGFDIDDEEDKRQLHAIYVESINFIASVLMPKEWKKGKTPPEDFFSEVKVHKLLFWASSTGENRKLHQVWSCAILRVMHTIAHIDEVDRFRVIQSAEKQILQRFEKALHRDHSDNSLWFGNKKNNIEIERFEWKPSKSRDSMILKLLHKQANVSETIYDLLGIRIVVKTAPDALRVVSLLHQLELISFSNTNPSRMRNSLLKLEKFKAHSEALTQMLSNDYINEEHFKKMIQKFDYGKQTLESENPHSQKGFRSIQITCRQRIKVDDPGNLWVEKLQNLEDESTAISEESRKIISQIVAQYQHHMRALKKEKAMYFPFEVQIIDASTDNDISTGSASHDRYKKSQLRTARRRVLHDVLRQS